MDTNLTLELFIGRGMIDKSLAKDIKEEMIASGKELPEVLADFGIIGSKDDIWQMIASDLGTEFITLDNFQPDPNVQNMMPATLVRLHGALPVRHGPEGLYVCLVDPLNPQTVEDLRFALGQDIHVLVAPDYQISERINELYGGESAAMSDLMQELNNMQVNNETEDSAAAPVIRFVDLVITQAIKEKASDIHFEPFEKEFKIRYRVDGALYEMQPPPVHLVRAGHFPRQGHGKHEHRGTPHSAGRPHRQADRKPFRGHARFLPSHSVRRIRGAPRSGPLFRQLEHGQPGASRAYPRIYSGYGPQAQRHFHRLPAPPAPARQLRCMPPCVKSIPLIPRC